MSGLTSVPCIGKNLGIKRPEFKSQLYHILAMISWISFFYNFIYIK